MIPRGFQVHLFGSFQLWEGNAERSLPASSRARLLLTYLFLNAGRPHSRLVLAALLSPDAPEETARRVLNQALWHIRQRLPGLLVCSRTEISLSSAFPIVIDVIEFEKCVRPHLSGEGDPKNGIRDLKRAVELYRGDLLEGVYEDWALLERERLRETYLQALASLIQLLKGAMDFESALHLALCLVKVDPLHEDAHREVMRLYHILGRSRAALKHYDEYCSLLKSELGVDPEAETARMAREIAQQSQGQSTVYLPEAWNRPGESPLEKNTGGQLPLVGRSGEKKSLLFMLEPVFSAQPAFVLLTGEPGVGKTRLLEDIQADLAWRGAQVILANVDEANAASGMGDLLLQAVQNGLSPLRTAQIRTLARPEQKTLLDWILSYLPRRGLDPKDPAAVDTRDPRQAIVEGLALLLGLWSQVTPLVFILEDLHWANQDAWEMLAGLAGSLYAGPATGVAFLASLRVGEAQTQPFIDRELREISSAGSLDRLELCPLDRPAAGDLVRVCLGTQQPPASVEDWLSREADGSPLLILEGLRLLYEQGKLTRNPMGGWQVDLTGDLASGAGQPVSPAVEGILARRIARLPPSVQEVLRRLAILGGSFDFASLRAMCAQDGADLLKDLRRLVQLHILVETEQGYHFRHGALRQAGCAGMTAVEQAGLHLRAGEVLEALHPEQVEAMAFHFQEGCDPGRAAQYYRKAGEAALRGHSYHQAVRDFAQSIALAPRARLSPEQLFQLRGLHESVADVLGDREAQAEDLRAMSQIVLDSALGPDDQLTVYFRRANWLYQTAQYAESESVARQALALAASIQDIRAKAKALAAIGSALHGAGRDALAVPPLQSAIPLLQSVGDRLAESKTWQTLAVIYADASEYRLAQQAIEASISLDRQLDNRSALAMDLFLTSHILVAQGELGRSEEYCREALDQSRATGNRLMEAAALSVLVDISAKQGCIGPALETGRQARAICRSIGEEKLQLSILIGLSDYSLFPAGDLEAAEVYIQEVEALARKHNLLRELLFCEGYRARMDLFLGNLASARRRLKKAVAGMQAQNCPVGEIPLRQLQVEVELAAGRPSIALGFLEEAEERQNQVGLAGCEPDLLGLRSAVLIHLGRPTEALEAACKAVSAAPEGNAAYPIHFAQYQALRANGKISLAYESLSRAVGKLDAVLASLTPAQGKSSRERIPLHRRIGEAWEELRPRQMEVRLPRSTASPAGEEGSGRDVQVVWTVWLAEDEETQDKVARRRGQVQRLLAEASRQGVSPAQGHLAGALGVSLRTIAQDLAALKRLAAEKPQK